MTNAVLRTLAMAVALQMAARATQATELDCEVPDAEGDALWQGKTDAVEVPPYLDIIRIEVGARDDGRPEFAFVMDMAGEVPAAPLFTLPSVKQLLWVWRMDTDPTTAPAGYPVAPGVPEALEFIVRIIWEGGSFRGELVDRRPLLTGGSATIVPMSFQISGATLSVVVDSSALGDPEMFRWGAATTGLLAAREGNWGRTGFDQIPFVDCPAF